jgi:hypothetical protein
LNKKNSSSFLLFSVPEIANILLFKICEPGDGDETQLYSTCLACMRPWVQFPALEKNNVNQKIRQPIFSRISRFDRGPVVGSSFLTLIMKCRSSRGTYTDPLLVLINQLSTLRI